jgi:hypothetical protein
VLQLRIERPFDAPEGRSPCLAFVANFLKLATVNCDANAPLAELNCDERNIRVGDAFLDARRRRAGGFSKQRCL